MNNYEILLSGSILLPRSHLSPKFITDPSPSSLVVYCLKNEQNLKPINCLLNLRSLYLSRSRNNNYIPSVFFMMHYVFLSWSRVSYEKFGEMLQILVVYGEQKR
ncbi:hypothetical protein RYX36_029350 [Vicia faba]